MQDYKVKHMREGTEGSAMSRTAVSQQELLQWLNTELAKHEECNDCRITSVKALRETDAEGCNWSLANLQCSGVPTVHCQRVANQVIAQARAKFNIK